MDSTVKEGEFQVEGEQSKRTALGEVGACMFVYCHDLFQINKTSKVMQIPGVPLELVEIEIKATEEEICLFVVTPPLPRDGGTTSTAIQVHAVNLIEIRLGERWQPISNQS